MWVQAPRIPQWAESWAHPSSTYDCAKSMGGHATLNFMTSYSDLDHQDMKILIWNTQGAGTHDFMNTLKEHIGMQRPQIVVLLETHISGSRADNVCKRIGFGGQYRVDARGFQGGIWVLWLDNQVQLNLIEAHDQFITVEVVVSGTRGWLFTTIYASPRSSGREELWKKLEGRALTTNHPWLLAGDFNETKTLDERDHGGADMARCCSKFNNWIENNALLDIGFTEPKFIWVRGHTPSTRKSARLNRALCNVAWRHRFQDGCVRHLVRHQLDHVPILISLTGFTPRVEEAKPFRFQAAWMLHFDFDNLIRQKWQTKIPIHTALGDLAGQLSTWSKEIFGNLFCKKRKIWGRIEGSKVGRVSGIDQTTANVERGKFSRLSVEVDLSKPLLSKVRFRGCVWRIQYEGIKFICFKCGKVEHGDESCPTYPMKENQDPTIREKAIRTDPTAAFPIHRPECMEEFGPWMLVKKPIRKKNLKTNNGGAREKAMEAHNPPGPRATRTRPTSSETRENGKHVDHGVKSAPDHPSISRGSRYAVLDNIVEGNQQENPEDVTMWETDALIDNLKARNQELIMEDDISEATNHGLDSMAVLQGEIEGTTGRPSDTIRITGPSSPKPIENLVARPPLSPDTLNRVNSITQADISRRTSSQAQNKARRISSFLTLTHKENRPQSIALATPNHLPHHHQLTLQSEHPSKRNGMLMTSSSLHSRNPPTNTPRDIQPSIMETPQQEHTQTEAIQHESSIGPMQVSNAREGPQRGLTNNRAMRCRDSEQDSEF
ncbi:hypothetical protein Cgig2_007567 [Carnegiea gigantea]|uniref:Endonuclease/exonuclease/phosphatase domain-containing protein n=1 Tax=Carnegiea gigantea TaxID=171969 RepID=A0A9Q1GJ19_9CARY|nr:hypothetical protein Cgig2_007567 [Carnegiea gigantea]